MPFAVSQGLRIYFEVFDSDGGVAEGRQSPVLTLVNGLGGQCISYRDEFCRQFARLGVRVVRIDNRDVGLSDDGPDGYTLADMADDVIAVLDELGVQRSHVWGMSLGGMIVQTLAIRRPDRLRSATSVMSTTGNLDVGRPTDEAKRLLTTPGSRDRSAAVAAHLRGLEVWGSPGRVDVEREAEYARLAFDRACRPDGVARQYRAARQDGSRDLRLAKVGVPFFVIHGTADTLIDCSGGRHTAAMVPGAHLTMIDGMGHDLPQHFWPALIDHFRRQVLPSSVSD